MWATRAIAFDSFKAFGTVWYVVPLPKLEPYGIPDQVFGLILSSPGNRWFRVITLDQKSSQDHLINAGVRQGSIFGPTLFQRYINDPDDFIRNIVIQADGISF